MYHNLSSYVVADFLINRIDAQMHENLLVRMENEFDISDVEDHKERAKLTKAFNRNMKETRPVVNEIYPLQVRFTQIKTNIIFLLENAHHYVSYVALARNFAEYEFLKKEILKECNKAKNNRAVQDFVERSDVLNTNYFDVFQETVKVMQSNIRQRMRSYPEQYIDLNIDVDSEIDFDACKKAFNDAVKKHKKAHTEAKKAAQAG